MNSQKIRMFLSHAYEDKDSIVQELYDALKNNFEVWYDTKSLQLGDSLTLEISNALSSCDYGIVVLSRRYMRKKWTRDEFVVTTCRFSSIPNYR